MDRTLASIKNSRRRTKRQRLETSEQSREETSEGISIIDPPVRKRKQPAKIHNRVNPPKYFCEICEDPANSIQSLLNNPCNHKFCNDCIVNYITSKLDMNIATILCPHTGCKSRSLDPLTYQEILPADTFNKWGLILCESSLGSKKFYCPFKDCSALLVNDGPKEVINCECPHCNRMFCAKCKVPWHGDMSCKKFRRLGKDEAWQENLILEKLAKDKGWRRCSQCRTYVDKIDGCKFMECRCGFCFCYVCCAPMSKITHYCKKCQS